MVYGGVPRVLVGPPHCKSPCTTISFPGHFQFVEYLLITLREMNIFHLVVAATCYPTPVLSAMKQDIVRRVLLDDYIFMQLGNDINGEAAFDFSGDAVSINSAGNIVAIGAAWNDGSGYDAGHVRVYEYSGSVWTKMGGDIDGEAAGDQSGFSVSNNDVGDIVAIGAYKNDGNGADAGHVRVYHYLNSMWTKMGSDIDGEAADDWSGYSVCINSAGDIVAISARQNDGNGFDSGQVRVYQYSGSDWVQRGNDIDGEAADDHSGWSISLNSAGNIVAIGAPLNDGNGDSSGHVRVFQYSGSVWTQLGSDIDGEAAYNYCGVSVDLNSAGDIVAIGATNNGDNGAGSGHVRVFQYANSVWTQLGSDIDGTAAYDSSGGSVSINAAGDIVAIGADANDGNGDRSGQVRVYQYSGSDWTQMGSDIYGAELDRLGDPVSLNGAGNIVAVGAFWNDNGGMDAGTTRVYEIVAAPTPAPTAVPTVSPVPTSMPSSVPTLMPFPAPTAIPTISAAPTSMPSAVPTSIPSTVPTSIPSAAPTNSTDIEAQRDSNSDKLLPVSSIVMIVVIPVVVLSLAAAVWFNWGVISDLLFGAKLTAVSTAESALDQNL